MSDCRYVDVGCCSVAPLQYTGRCHNREHRLMTLCDDVSRAVRLISNDACLLLLLLLLVMMMMMTMTLQTADVIT